MSRKLKDGVYHAAAKGCFGDIPVDVTVQEGRIADIKVLPNRDTPDFSYYPSIKIPQIVTEYQTLDVDVISGATFSSRGIIRAITKCLEEAGGDIEALRKVPGPAKRTGEVEEKECDVCVLGTGGAGSCAAARAAQLGAKVIVLEKASYNGGISQAANCMLAVNSKPQLEAGVKLDIKEIYDHMIQWSHYYGNGKLISRHLRNTADTVEWLRELGVIMEYRGKEQYTSPYDTPVHFVGFRDRAARRGQLKTILDSILPLGGEIYYETRGKSLIKENGKVVGVRAVREDGSELVVRAKAVVVATGCFDGNKELADRYFKDKARFCMPKWFAEGDGLLMCIEAGAQTKDLGARVLHLNRPERGLLAASGFPGQERCEIIRQMVSFPAVMLVNYKGHRYTNEWVIHNSLGSANVNATQGAGGDYFALISDSFMQKLIDEGAQAMGVNVVPGGFCSPFTNEGFFRDMRAQMEAAIEVGLAVKGETPEELAGKLGIEPEILRAEVERYNGFCRNGEDQDFYKDPSLLHAMEGGPYYAIRGTSESYGSIGGVMIDEQLRVMDTNLDPIPGLYCAGACAGGVWGNDSYGILEGGTCSWSYNSGKMAGDSVMEYLGQMGQHE